MVKLNIIDNKFVACPLDETKPTIEVTEEQFNLIMDGKLVWKNGQLVDNTSNLQKQARIADLIHNLEDTDYITNKLEEANVYFQITGDKTKLLSMYEEYKDLLTQREAWRVEIRELEEEVS